MPLARRLPKRGFVNPNKIQFATVNLGELGEVTPGTTIDLAWLRERGLVKKGRDLLKILADGDMNVNLTVRAHKFSKAAQEKITKAGGTVEILEA